MKIKLLLFSFVFALLAFGSVKYEAYASDTEMIIETSVEAENDANEADTASEIDAVVEAVKDNQQKLAVIHMDLRNITALLLILVVFETLRIVRSWSKGIGVK